MPDATYRKLHHGEGLVINHGWAPHDRLAQEEPSSDATLDSTISHSYESTSISRKQTSVASIYYQDTCKPYVLQSSPELGSLGPKEAAKAVVENSSKKGSFTDFFKAVWNWMSTGSTEDPKVEEVQAPAATTAAASEVQDSHEALKKTKRPRLQSPEAYQADTDQLTKEMTKLSHRLTNDVEEDTQDLFKKNPDAIKVYAKDMILYRQLVEAIITQKSSRHEAIEVGHHKLVKSQEIKKAHHTHMNELREKQVEFDKASDVLNWVGSALSIAILAIFVACVVITIVTAGAALPLALTAASAALSVSQGAATGAKGYVDYKSQDLEKSHIGERFQRDENQVNIKEVLRVMKDSYQWAAKAISLQAQVMKNLLELISGFFR